MKPIPSDGVLAPVENPALRLTESFNDTQANEDCPHRIDGAVLVAEYIVEEIQKNAKSSIVQKMAEHNRSFREAEIPNQTWHPDLTGGAPPLDIGIRLKTTEDFFQSRIAWIKQVFKGQAWDHKPIIREKFRHVAVHRPVNLKNKHSRISQSHFHKYKKYDYFLDIWSNIHYGYIGLLSGFSQKELLAGADVAQLLDSKGKNMADTPDDQVSIQLGFDIYELYGNSVEKLNAQIILEKIEAAPYKTSDNNQDGSRYKHWCFSIFNAERIKK